jgi:hypothetical protein
MPLNLHPNARAAVVSALAEGMPHVTVKNGCLLNGFTAFLASYGANAALPATGRLHDSLVEFIDDLPLVEFVTEQLRRELSENPELSYSNDETNVSLVTLPGYQDVNAAASRLIETFESLPWNLTFSIQLPRELFQSGMLQEGPMPLGPHGRVSLPDLLFSSQYPLSHANQSRNSRARGPGALGLLSSAASWDEDRPCYQHDDQGFVGMYGGGNVVDRVDRGLESFLGLGLATRLFTYSYRYENEKAKGDWIVHVGDDQQKEFLTKFSADEDTLEVLRHIVPFRFESRGQ